MGRYGQTKPKKSSNILIWLVLVLIIAAGMGWFYFNLQQPADITEPQTQTQPLALPPVSDTKTDTQKAPIPTGPDMEAPDADIVPDIAEESQQGKGVILPDLANSDGQIREDMIRISPGLSEWLNTDQLIRKYITIANDFSQGLRLEKHMRFLKPGERFAPDENLFMSRQSYQRYDKLAAAISALDVEAALAVYKKFRPLFVQVFAEFGYPAEYKLEDILAKAGAEILAAPAIDAPIPLVQPGVLYKYADSELENASPVHKQMLRMGPENTRIIQQKVRLLLEGLVNLKD